MKKMKFIDSVRVGSPCTEDWDEMVGNEKVRFCTHCAKDVNNLSEMTRKDALKLVRRSGGNLCIRYRQHPETMAPMFSEQLVQVSRRAPRMAAGVMAAGLSLATVTYAQGGSISALERSTAERPAEKSCPDVAEKATTATEKKTTQAGSGVVSGTISDPNGAVIPGSRVKIVDDKGNAIQTAITGDDGSFRIEGVTSGTYVVVVESNAFKTTETQNVAVEEGKETVVNFQLEVSSEVVTVGGAMVSVVEYEGQLASAVARDEIDEVRDLVARGEDVNAKERDGTTPLFIAVENGNIEMVRLLLDFGAKVNARNAERETPLMKIDEDANVELVELLLRSGAKVNAVSSAGNTPLILAAEYSAPEVLQALIDAGAEIDAQNEEGESALMKAADNESLEKVRALINAGANVNLTDKDGDNAWDYTAEEAIEALLIAHGVIVEPEIEDTPVVDNENSDDN
jgi:hypothetical protein